MSTPLRLLILEDLHADIERMIRELQQAGFNITWQQVDNRSDFLAQLDLRWDCILADYWLPNFNALEALRILDERKLDIPFIIVTNDLADVVAVDYLQPDNRDYLLKNNQGRLGMAVAQALHHKQLRDQKHQAEMRLEESEERYRKLVELSPDGIAIHVDTRLVFINQAGASLIGTPDPSRLIGRSIFDFIHPDYIEINRERARQIAAGITTPPLEQKFIRLDRQLIDVEVAATPHQYQGKPAVQTVFRDITARKQTQEVLRQAEQRYRDLFMEAPVIYVIVRIIEDEPIVADCNQLFLQTLGYDRTAVVNQPLLDFYAPGSDVSLWSADHFSPDQLKSPQALECQLQTVDGTLIETLLYTSPEIDRDGQVSGIRAAYVDITARKQAEAALRQRNRELMVVQYAGATIASTLDIDQILHIVTREMVELLGAQTAKVFEWQAKSNTLTEVAWYELTKPIQALPRQQPFSPHNFPLLDQVLSKRAPVQITYNQAGLSSSDQNLLDQFGSGTLVMLPMVFQDRALGLIVLGNHRPSQSYNEQQIGLLQLLANQAAGAIENSRLFHIEQKRSQEAEALQRTALALVATLDLDQVIDRILAELQRVVPYDSATVQILAHDRVFCISPKKVYSRRFYPERFM